MTLDIFFDCWSDSLEFARSLMSSEIGARLFRVLDNLLKILFIFPLIMWRAH